MTIEKLLIGVSIFAAVSTIAKRMLDNKSNILIFFLQSFLGGLFIFSGVVKAIDPSGTAIKMHDYFTSFASDGMADFWYSLDKFSMLFSVSMITLEIALGVAVLFGWLTRLSSWGMLAINVFFLYLTGYSYLSGFCITNVGKIVPLVILGILLLVSWIPSDKKRFQAVLISFILMGIFLIYAKTTGSWAGCEFDKTKMKVTDCGCFGDFMKLHPWTTFYKDVLLTFLSAILVAFYHKMSSVFKSPNQTIMVGIGSTLLALLFCLYNFLWTEPIIDFRPYAVGQDIKKNMIDPVAPVSEFVFLMKNKATGEEKQFKMEEYPTDTVWEYKDRIEKVIKEGVLAPIKNLRLEDNNRQDITQSMLNSPTKSYWIICAKPEKTNLEAFKDKLSPFIENELKKGAQAYILLPSINEKIKAQLPKNVDIVICDETPLKTMIRSNPGLMEIENGIVKNKWHWRHVPAAK